MWAVATEVAARAVAMAAAKVVEARAAAKGVEVTEAVTVAEAMAAAMVKEVMVVAETAEAAKAAAKEGNHSRPTQARRRARSHRRGPRGAPPEYRDERREGCTVPMRPPTSR